MPWLPGQDSNLRRTVVNSHPLCQLSYRGIRQAARGTRTRIVQNGNLVPDLSARAAHLPSAGLEPATRRLKAGDDVHFTSWAY